MLELALDMPNQVLEGFECGKEISFKGFNKIIAVGMGGSGISGNVLKAMIDFPVTVYNDYNIDEEINSKTLLFVVSYSGNTEEPIQIYKDSLKTGCKICGVSSGGKLTEMCKKDKIPCVNIPKGIEPRGALAYLVFPMVKVMQNSGILKVDIKRLSKLMKQKSFVTKAKDIANKIGKNLPIIYSSEKFRVVGYRWKCEFNENSKIWAISNVFPEANHNEILPLTKKSNITMVIIKDKNDNKRVKRRIDVINKIASRKHKVIIIEPKGKNMVEKVFSTIYLGDLVSCYLAEKLKVDANDMVLLEEFKKML